MDKASYKRILLRSGKSPHEVINPFIAYGTSDIGYYGGNVGNVLFADSVYKTLNTPTSEIVVDGYSMERDGVDLNKIDYLNNEYDVFVAPFANLFRESWVNVFKKINPTIQKLKIPIVMVSGGLQMAQNQVFDDLSSDLKEQSYLFCKTILNSGAASIGVRGQKTKDFLVHIGIPQDLIDVIGCPSMYYNGKNLQITKDLKEINNDHSIAMNVNFEAPQISQLLNYHFEKYSNFSYISQIHEEFSLILYGHPFLNHPHQNMPDNVNHPIFKQNKIGFPIEAQGWINYMKTQNFVFGTRLHGCVAGFLANVPTCIFRYDSRTSELIDVHKFPFIEVDINKPVFDANELYQQVDFTDFNNNVDRNFDNYLKFLERNSLSHIYQKGNENYEYQKLLDETEFYNMIFPSIIQRPEVVRAGLAYLHGRNKEDFHRYHNEDIADVFKVTGRRDLSYHDFYVETRKQLRQMQQEVDSLKALSQITKRKKFWK